jgi:2-polyprenyl-3-methyl-5-hydroxy-6-metoxy-1,4-benzoquinol methylase
MTVNDEAMTSILWRRLRYMLTPQFDLYKNIAPKLKDLMVLEVGFGTGFGTVQLAQYAKEVIAIEYDADAVKFAKQVLPLKNVWWIESDITAALNKPIYDAVVMVETLEHIKKWRKALTKIHGLLKPGGCLYMTARNRNADLRRNDLHERELSASELRANLGEFFLDVTLYDYTLANEQSDDTHITPLIAVARKAGGNETNIGNNTSARWVKGRAEQTRSVSPSQTAVGVYRRSGEAQQVSN